MRPVYAQGGPHGAVAGADWSWSPSTASPFKVRGVYGVLATSATVASRQPALYAKTQDGSVFFAKAVEATQAASLTYGYSWSSGSGPAQGGSSAADALVSDGVPDWWLPAGTIVSVTTAGLSAGDQWSEVFGAFEIWNLLAEQQERRQLAGMIEGAISDLSLG